jgi:hypothetical protein
MQSLHIRFELCLSLSSLSTTSSASSSCTSSPRLHRFLFSLLPTKLILIPLSSSTPGAASAQIRARDTGRLRAIAATLFLPISHFHPILYLHRRCTSVPNRALHRRAHDTAAAFPTPAPEESHSQDQLPNALLFLEQSAAAAQAEAKHLSRGEAHCAPTAAFGLRCSDNTDVASLFNASPSGHTAVHHRLTLCEHADSQRPNGAARGVDRAGVVELAVCGELTCDGKRRVHSCARDAALHFRCSERGLRGEG